MTDQDRLRAIVERDADLPLPDEPTIPFQQAALDRRYLLGLPALLAAGIQASVTLQLVAGATDQRYTPTEVAEIIGAAVDEQLARLGV